MRFYGLAGALAFVLAVASPALAGDPIIIQERSGRNVFSANWSGYAVTGPRGTVTDAQGSWVVPAIATNNGKCGIANSYAAFWTGIDGYDSNTVEQIGTSSDCQGGTPRYYAWFELYPRAAIEITALSIRPGDVIAANVHYEGRGKFSLSILNATSGAAFTTSGLVPNAARSSAEWVAEAPSSGGVLPLADFGVLNSGLDHTAQNGTCYATVGGRTGPIGSFTSNAEITMESLAGAIKALPSLLSQDGSSFSVQWKSAGP